MKCRIIKMRKEGVDLPRYKLHEQLAWLGALVVMDVKDDGVGRTIKVAKHISDVNAKYVELLYEPRLIWMNEGKFTIAGFERVRQPPTGRPGDSLCAVVAVPD